MARSSWNRRVVVDWRKTIVAAEEAFDQYNKKQLWIIVLWDYRDFNGLVFKVKRGRATSSSSASEYLEQYQQWIVWFCANAKAPSLELLYQRFTPLSLPLFPTPLSPLHMRVCCVDCDRATAIG